MLGIFAIAGTLLLYLLLGAAYDACDSRRVAALIGLSAVSVWPGLTAFHELRGGYYDAVALCLVVAAFATPSRILTGIFVFLAAWTDERALIAACFLARAGRALRLPDPLSLTW